MVNKTYTIADVLNNPYHEAYTDTVAMLADLESGAISLCACMGVMYGEPLCLCAMKRAGLQDVMDNNPLAEATSAAQWEAMFLPGDLCMH